jgi:hypothetical protein
MAHLVFGALRRVAHPGRYVSGYLMPKPDGELGVPYAGESHAWMQYWDDGWVGADPTNNIRPGDLHVEVAVGRDYRDVAPLHRHLHREPDLRHVRLRGDHPAVVGQSSGAVWMTWKAGSS